MAKEDKNKKKNPSVEAPVVEPEKKEDKVPAIQETKVEIPGVPQGLDQNHKADMIGYAQHRKDEMLRTNENNPEKYKALTMIEDAFFIDTALTEAVIRKNPIGHILTINEANYKSLQVLANEMGVTLPDYKSLPKPTKEQLTAVGLEAATGQVVLAIEDKNVSKETKEKKKKEQKIIDESVKKDYMKDHTKIETDEQLKEAIGFQLVNPAITNPIERLVTTAQFYRSYLEARSDKAEDQKAELDRIHALSLADLLQEIITMVPPTFIATGFGNLLGRRAHDANSIIPAFCMFKNCVIDRKTGKAKYSDEEIAAFVRVLIAWYISSKTAEMGEAIKAKEENIKVLKKDEKANAKGIETENKKIAGLKKSIEHFNGMLTLISDPSFDIVDDFIAAYKNSDNANHMYAVEIAKSILDTYYRGADIPELEFDSALLNIQQRAGIILNLFTTEIVKRDEYSESNLIVIDEIEDRKPVENKPTEEEPKNS